MFIVTQLFIKTAGDVLLTRTRPHYQIPQTARFYPELTTSEVRTRLKHELSHCSLDPLEEDECHKKQEAAVPSNSK